MEFSFVLAKLKVWFGHPAGRWPRTVSAFSTASPPSQGIISLGQTGTVGQLAATCEFERGRLGHKYKHCQ